MAEEQSSAVLRDLSNESEDTNEDEDFALAKLMQEQERAFFHARNLYGYGENGPELPEYAPPHEATDTEPEELEQEGEDAEGAATEQEPVDDEELARRLHIQEQIEHQRRLMELAGINPDDEEYTEEEEEGYLTDDSVDPDEMTYEELRALGEAVGVVSRGASVDVIEALPMARYVGPIVVPACGGLLKEAAASASQRAAQEEQCVVCRMEFESGEDVKVLPCRHVFHAPCVEQWLLINKACPICSKEVTAAVQTEGGSISAEGCEPVLGPGNKCE